ncbi:pre-mRNA-processing factor 39 isoform X2 [Chiloscyllium plagiosum]|uniref:pre-mRNA-processing factor 39 isoform X2 n=1 Tax=Chiloscyllium plagiosum TaxID=36176 RepID=UPI001CB816C3|nr:pre-mRNA-processing factor 39 isoform X2 [Chiloscyllium plagiosum]
MEARDSNQTLPPQNDGLKSADECDFHKSISSTADSLSHELLNPNMESADEAINLKSRGVISEDEVDQTTSLKPFTDLSEISVAQVESPEGSASMDTESQPENSPPEGTVEEIENIELNDSGIPFPTEYEKFWKVVEDNPQDFTGWTYLLQYVEQENHILAARKAFDHFLSHYPYCYGYWKKYADLERRHHNVKRAEEVYRRGLQAIPLSVDLWLHYINFLKETLDSNCPEIDDQIKSVFEHAVLAAGTDFRSDRLWETYINWENDRGNLEEVTTIYDRILGIPTQLYSHHFQRFKDHVQNHLPKDIISSEDFIKLRQELASTNEHFDNVTPGNDLTAGIDINDPAQIVSEIENMRHRIIEVRQEIYNHNENEVSRRWAFEEGIKRPYFHVKPLEKIQLKNWKDYLDFEIENGTLERVVVLFERCLVACALYEDFWIKYAKYMENHSSEAVRHVYSRACTVHLSKKPMVHLLWAAFEEQQGNINEARRILKMLEESVPGLAMVRLRRVSLERRHGNMDEAEFLLQDAIKNSKTPNEASFYAVKLARLLFKVEKSLPKARKVLLEAIDFDKESTKLYLNLLELEYNSDLKLNEENILNAFDKAISSSMAIETRIAFSQRKVEFLEDFGSDVKRLMVAYDHHQQLLKEQESSKRKAENGSEEPEEKKQRSDATLASAQLMSGDLQANQSAYNYNAWYQYNYAAPWNYGQYYPPPT